MKRIKFFVCEKCGNIVQSTGTGEVTCCNKKLTPLSLQKIDESHKVKISEIENDYYIEFSHDMSKEHYISFVTLVKFDRVFTVKLYPEQDSAVRLPKVVGAKILFYCNNHGLFEI